MIKLFGAVQLVKAAMGGAAADTAAGRGAAAYTTFFLMVNFINDIYACI